MVDEFIARSNEAAKAVETYSIRTELTGPGNTASSEPLKVNLKFNVSTNPMVFYARGESNATVVELYGERKGDSYDVYEKAQIWSKLVLTPKQLREYMGIQFEAAGALSELDKEYFESIDVMETDTEYVIKARSHGDTSLVTGQTRDIRGSFEARYDKKSMHIKTQDYVERTQMDLGDGPVQVPLTLKSTYYGFNEGNPVVIPQSVIDAASK